MSAYIWPKAKGLLLTVYDILRDTIRKHRDTWNKRFSEKEKALTGVD